jgi:hypothetical protein
MLLEGGRKEEHLQHIPRGQSVGARRANPEQPSAAVARHGADAIIIFLCFKNPGPKSTIIRQARMVRACVCVPSAGDSDDRYQQHRPLLSYSNQPISRIFDNTILESAPTTRCFDRLPASGEGRGEEAVAACRSGSGKVGHGETPT